MKFKHLEKSLKEAPVIKKGDYNYVVHPLTDGIPYITPELLTEVTNNMIPMIQKQGKLDRIVTMEAMGIPLATALSLKMNIPFTIIRKRSYGLPGEISVEQQTGYSKSKLYINGLKSGDRIILVDDVLSTGGTLKAVLTVLQKMKVEVKAVYIAVYKGSCKEVISTQYHIPIITLAPIDVIEGKTVLLPEH